MAYLSINVVSALSLRTNNEQANPSCNDDNSAWNDRIETKAAASADEGKRQ